MKIIIESYGIAQGPESNLYPDMVLRHCEWPLPSEWSYVKAASFLQQALEETMMEWGSSPQSLVVATVRGNLHLSQLIAASDLGMRLRIEVYGF